MDEKLKSEIERAVKEANEIYEYIESQHGRQDWMGDTERFIALTFLTTRDLIKHSVILSRLTKWLIGLTITLAIIAVVQAVFMSIQLWG